MAEWAQQYTSFGVYYWAILGRWGPLFGVSFVSGRFRIVSVSQPRPSCILVYLNEQVLDLLSDAVHQGRLAGNGHPRTQSEAVEAALVSWLPGVAESLSVELDAGTGRRLRDARRARPRVRR